MVYIFQIFFSNENNKFQSFYVSIVLFYSFLVLPYIFCREMIKTLNSKYKPPNRDGLTNHLIPAWYGVEKSNLITDLKHVTNAAITADGWTSFSQDHYLTVTLHYVREGQSQEKVLRTKAVYQAQTGIAVAEEIEGILEEFGVKEKVVAATVDNAANMDVAVKKLNIIKFPCFAHTLNLGAQKLYNCNTVSNWAARIRSVIVWMRRSHMAKVVLKEKQQLLKLPQHMLLLDVRTRWNSLYLMMERFCEQFPAIQAAAIDQRLRKPMEKEKLARMGNEDLRKAEEFVKLMRMPYTSTLADTSEKVPTCGQILPILQKLREHYTVQTDDSAFVRSVKENIWNDLSKRYQDGDIQAFLEEATVLDPRFKSKMDMDDIWDRVRASAVEKLSEPRETQGQAEEEDEGEEEEEEEDYTPPVKQKKMTALEELFEEEDGKLLSTQQLPPVSTAQRVDQEIQLYRSLPPILTKDSASLWWWKKSDTLPVLSALAEKYLCVQASSTPSERVFSTAGDTLSPERSRILPERANMIIFLHKNC
ncbi:zinc finger BED domain-containing protein 4-like isoform X2 [Gadus chalcogrammus]|uniref:zinc finger BED domain-containing protein 4-like isoform X2 n=1 Tax=Gadus chalcogrammus TaxID=1042646 RepID=UPI0024C34F2A|nr:zinc finger BED domain-containing protein 4-like isoform X2 [Gadus chalcogrammus]